MRRCEVQTACDRPSLNNEPDLNHQGFGRVSQLELCGCRLHPQRLPQVRHGAPTWHMWRAGRGHRTPRYTRFNKQ